MKNNILQILKFANVLVAFLCCLYLISKGHLLFPLLLAAYTTYINSKIDEILKGTD
jgi:hypothetical protein